MSESKNHFERIVLRLIGYGYFKNKGEVVTAIGERSLTPILDGSKRLRADHLQDLKSTVPLLNIDSILTGDENTYLSGSESTSSLPQSTYVREQSDISSLVEDISSRLDPEGQKLISHFKVEIDQLIQERDKAKDKIITVIEMLEKST